MLSIHNLGGHNSVQSPSEIFFRVAYSIKPFGLKFVLNPPLTFLSDHICDGSRKEPGLFEKLDDGQPEELQIFHANDFSFNFPQSALCGKKRRAGQDFGFCESFYITETSGLVLCFNSS